MKKLLAIVLATVMVVSMFAVSASAFMDVTENFDELPAGLEDREDVAIQSNKALKMSYTASEWGYKGFVSLSNELIDYNSTVSFYVKTNEYPDGWCHRLALALSDAIGKGDESQTMGGIATNGNCGRTVGSRSLGYISYNIDAEVPGTAIIYPNQIGNEEYSNEGDFIEFVADQWFRIDLLVDFDNHTTDVYVDGAKYATANHSPNAVGYKGFKSYLFSSGNYAQDFYIDEMVVREGLIVPEDGDLIANQDRDAIEADETVTVYEPFDALNANTLSNTSKIPYSATEIDGFNQSTLSVEVSYGENDFADVYLPMSEIDLEDNATISFKMMTSFTTKKLPGLNLKLVNADKEVLGGFVVSNDSAKFMFDDGEHVFGIKGEDDKDIAFTSGKWYQISLLLNHANHSLTIYVDGVRFGTIALENADLEGFTGILLSKHATTGAKPQKFTFDNLSAVEGLYAPGVAEELAEDDALVTIDRVYVEVVDTTTKAPDTTKKPADTTTKAPDTTKVPDNTTDAPDNTTKAPDNTDNKPDGGCGGVSLGAIIVLAVGMFGVGFTVIKKK